VDLVLLPRMKTLLVLLVLTSLAGAGDLKPPISVPADAKHFNGHWYKVFLEKCTWRRAKERCGTLGGRLAVISDEPTWAFVKGLTPAIVWLGATDEETEGVWKWVDGTELTFKAWLPKQPDNIRGKEHYLATRGDKWNDVPLDGKSGAKEVVGFICEWKQ
jgi:hypothetical protein